jgi:hypothetical protein
LGPVHDNDALGATPVAPFDGVGDFGAAGNDPAPPTIIIAKGTPKRIARKSGAATFSEAAAVCDAAIVTYIHVAATAKTAFRKAIPPS